MSNGRSFRRNRKGSPGKSLRKQRQRERTAAQFHAMANTASSSMSDVADKAAKAAAQAAVDAINRKSGAAPEPDEDEAVQE